MAQKTPKGLPTKRCAVCRHEQRVLIEHQAARPEAKIKIIERHYGLPQNALWRHWRDHVSDERKITLALGPQTRLADLAKHVESEDKAVLDHVNIMLSLSYDNMLAAHEVGDRGGVSVFMGRAKDFLEMKANLNGQVKRLGSSVMVQQNNYFNGGNGKIGPITFSQLQMFLVDTLQNHPDAYADVVRGLRRMAGGELTALPAPVVEGHAADVAA